MKQKPSPPLEDILPLAPLQEGLLFHSLYDTAGPDLYTAQMTMALKGRIDAVALKRSLETLLVRHANLRASFRIDGLRHPVQVIRREVPVPFRELDWSAVDAATVERRFADWAEADWGERFDMSTAPLFRFTLIRLGHERFRLVLTNHHILLDGWSKPILLMELFALHARGGVVADLPAVTPYREYLAWVARQDRRAARQQWESALAGLESGTHLAPTAPRTGPPPHQLQFAVSERLTTALTALARRHHWTLSTLVQGAWGLVLHRLTGRDDVVFGNTVAGRPADIPGIETMIGLFINTLPVRLRFRHSESLEDVLVRLQQEQATLLPYHHLTLTEIRRLAAVGDLFDTSMVFENYPIMRQVPVGPSPATIRIKTEGHRDATHYPLSLVFMPGTRLRMRIGYRPDLFERQEINTLGERIERVLGVIAADPKKHVGALSVLSAVERDRVTVAWNASAMDVGSETITSMIEMQATHRPDAVSVVHEDRHLTFAALESRANKLAHLLIDNGVAHESVVAIALTRSLDLAVAVLGTWKAGAAYLALDPTYPIGRLTRMVEQMQPRVLITQQGLPSGPRLPLNDIQPLYMDHNPELDDRGQPGRPLLSHNLEQAAYVLYTSGSTGQPKGVIVTHGGLPSLAASQAKSFEVTAQSRVIQFASLNFDASVWELVMSLANGATLVQVPEEARLGAPLQEWLVRHQVTHATVPPIVAATLRNELNLPLMFLIVAGDVCPPALVAAWSEGYKLINAYGPTEITVCATVSRPLHAGQPPTIGTPIANTRVYVMDGALQPTPVGVVGEIYVAGNGLARGYTHEPAQTAERFVANPWGAPGTRMFRTGDLAIWQSDGSLRFVGRADRQVKIRGFRIELSEVEAAFRGHSDVHDAVVLVQEDAHGERRLVAYLVAIPDHCLDIDSVRREASHHLPEYMMPEAVVTLERLPLTRNGKVDRSALPVSRIVPATRYRAPRTGDEAKLCMLFAEVLGVEKIGIDDNFFEQGGNSISAMRLLSRLHAEVEVGISTRAFFDSPTVAGLVDTVLADCVGEIGVDPFAVLLPLRSTGANPPLFCLHPAGGISWAYSALLQYIVDRPVYGVQARGLKHGECLPRTLSDMVADYAQQIRSVQPTGPYYLLGSSLGGVLAHALANMLREQGDAIGLLALIDSAPIPSNIDRNAIPPPPAQQIERFRAAFQALAAPENTVDNLVSVWENCIRLACTGLPGRFDGDAVLIVGSLDGREDPGRDAEAQHWWRPFIAGQIRIHHVPAAHDEMLKPIGLARIGPLLASELATTITDLPVAQSAS